MEEKDQVWVTFDWNVNVASVTCFIISYLCYLCSTSTSQMTSRHGSTVLSRF